MPDIRPLSELTDPREFLAYLGHVGAELPFDADVEHGPSSPLARAVSTSGLTAGNRFCVLPLEGWDADLAGRPTAATRERWRRKGQGGAKLIWGESAAVRPDGRSTPAQLLVADDTVSDLAALRQLAVDEHERAHGDVSDFVVGLQLTHSGRMSHPAPDGLPAPVAVRRHPHMDATVGPSPDQPLLTDDELYALAADFVRAAAN
ncbi:MAG: NADH:flavin oxidoreductase, partial [Ilumatobacteraceae bacterium]